MELIIIIVSIIALTGFVFVFTHLRPLDEDEVKQLATKRRDGRIRGYFSYELAEFNIDKGFKKRMNPNGAFYKINEDLFEFPSIASALLKYKKHEWIIIAFEVQRTINSIWLNKGFDRSEVSPHLSARDMVNIAKRENYTSILIFHNHPNSNPRNYDCRNPSSTDLESANEFTRVFNAHGVNLVEFICERGIHHEYLLSPANSFLPLSDFAMAVDDINGLSKLKNLSLHIERIL